MNEQADTFARTRPVISLLWRQLRTFGDMIQDMLFHHGPHPLDPVRITGVHDRTCTFTCPHVAGYTPLQCKAETFSRQPQPGSELSCGGWIARDAQRS